MQEPVNSLLTTWFDLWEWSSLKWSVVTGIQQANFFLALGLIAIYFIFRIDRYQLWWGARLLWAYAVIRALWVVEFPLLHYGIDTLAFLADAGRTLIESIIIPAFVIFMGEKSRLRLWYSLRFGALALLVCVWLGWKGTQIAPSFNLALVALYLPFAPLWVLILAIPTIMFNHAGTAQLMVFAQIATYIFVWFPKKLSIPAIFCGMAATLGVIYVNSHGPMLDMWGRIDRWRLGSRFMCSWLYSDYKCVSHDLNLTNIFFGVGPGSFARVSVLIDNFKTPMAIFLHNEFEQIPWEYGVIALFLCLLCYGRALWLSRRDSELFPALVSLGVFCFFWHPTRFAISAMMVALIVREGLRYRYTWKELKEKQKTPRQIL